MRVEIDESRCPWRWRGQYADEETGLYYNRFRYYDPSAGRYISPDPTGVDGGLNLYAYVSNPLVAIDPLGLDWNYVLMNNGQIYYAGRASDNDTDKGVERRHSKTQGADGFRFDKSNGDSVVRITPKGVSVPKKDSRGIEDLVVEQNNLNIGRREEVIEAGCPALHEEAFCQLLQMTIRTVNPGSSNCGRTGQDRTGHGRGAHQGAGHGGSRHQARNAEAVL